MDYNIQDFGTIGDGIKNDADAIQATIDTCAENGGGRVILPAGIYCSGTIFLKSNVELFFESGAELLGSPRATDYTDRWNAPYDQGCVSESASSMHLIYSWRQTNIAITGQGTVNGNGTAFFDLDVEISPRRLSWGWKNRWRPGQMVALLECENVQIDGVTFCNSPYWTIWPYACRDVVITNIRIRNDYRAPNGDGINPDCCTNVRIANCDIQAGDDCIALRANQAKAGFIRNLENVVITNCILDTAFGGVRFGPSGEKSVLRNIVVSNCVVRRAGKGLLFSLWHGGAWNKGCLIENVRISNMVIHADNPFRMYIQEGCGGPECGFRNIHISNITAFGKDTCTLFGGGGGVCEDIVINDFDLTLSGLEPCFPIKMKKVDGSAFAIRDAKRVQLRNIQLKSAKAALKHIVNAENVEGLKISDCAWQTSTLSDESLRCENVTELLIENTHF